MGIVSKFIFDVKNFLYRKIHKVKVKFRTKGHSPQHAYSWKVTTTMASSDDFLQIDTNFIKIYSVIAEI